MAQAAAKNAPKDDAKAAPPQDTKKEETTAETISGAEDQQPDFSIRKPTALAQQAHAIMVWRHTAEFGEHPEAFLSKDAWAHVAKSLQPGHIIEVIAPDTSWYLKLMVRAVGRTEAVVGKLSFAELSGDVTVSDDVPYSVKFRGPASKWSVLNKETGSVVKENFDTEEGAAKWVREHMKALAA